MTRSLSRRRWLAWQHQVRGHSRRNSEASLPVLQELPNALRERAVWGAILLPRPQKRRAGRVLRACNHACWLGFGGAHEGAFKQPDEALHPRRVLMVASGSVVAHTGTATAGTRP